MRVLHAALAVLLWTNGAVSLHAQSSAKSGAARDFPHKVRVRLWYLHPPAEVKLRADAGQAKIRKCATCTEAELKALTLKAAGARIESEGDKSSTQTLHVSGTYQVTAGNAPSLKAYFPVDVRATDGRLLVTASMPVETYVAGVLAGETGNFKSDETLKAMAVTARTYAMHFGSRHTLDGFDFCDSTHCQNLRLADVTPRMQKIAAATQGEILWYDGEPAASYYHANCGGTTEDGRYILGNDEQRAPYLKEHSDSYCVRTGSSQWRSEVSKVELQKALGAEGIDIRGRLRSVTVTQRTESGRVELVAVTGSARVTVPGIKFRAAIGHSIGWERIKSNWYDVRDAGEQIVLTGSGSGHGVGLCQVGAEVMGEEGKSYREILGFYYPGTRIGVSAQGIRWQQLGNADVVLYTTRPESDRPLLSLATQFMHESEEATGLVYGGIAKLKVYATVAAFRDATGEPGWVAASTRGRTVRMQPADVLRSAGTLESTLRHELFHMLVEEHAKPATPLWFREGLVLYLTKANTPQQGGAFESAAALEKALRGPLNEEQMRQAYASAEARVAKLAQAHGGAALVDWLQNGVPEQ